jgi:hypothetical protein
MGSPSGSCFFRCQMEWIPFLLHRDGQKEKKVVCRCREGNPTQQRLSDLSSLSPAAGTRVLFFHYSFPSSSSLVSALPSDHRATTKRHHCCVHSSHVSIDDGRCEGEISGCQKSDFIYATNEVPNRMLFPPMNPFDPVTGEPDKPTRAPGILAHHAPFSR